MAKGRKSGFTLIELLVVIAIIGILSSVVLASLNSARQKSRDARRVADIKQLQLALELYFDADPDNDGAHEYPATLAAVRTEGYIASIPVDPQSGSAYAYCINSGATDYHAGAVIEDTDSAALDSDVDEASDGCASGSFNGNAASCLGATAAAPDPCYDVTP